MVRKCGRIAKIAVMEVDQVGRGGGGVKNKARAASPAADSSSASAKRRKVGREEVKLSMTSCVQLQKRKVRRISQENSSSPSSVESIVGPPRTLPEDSCSSSGSDHGAAFCCSSNGSSELVDERFENLDLGVENGEVDAFAYKSGGGRRKMPPPEDLRSESNEMESTARQTETNSRRKSVPAKMPNEFELEEFFSAAEKGIQQRFMEKYNYDIVKDVPLEGRYQWVRLKP